MQISKFKKTIWAYYHEHKRDLPWRNTTNPYHIVVSEIMLQQTQVERVKFFYERFLKQFPTVQALASAPLTDVITAWKGLGYNRRAVNIKKMAEEIVTTHQGVFPKNFSSLMSLKGIGQSTAGALMNFAFNIPTAFIETNIRTVYLHHFFKDQHDITDKQIMAIIEKTTDKENPREWYYALYDYGTMLKKTIGNQNTRSASYKKQSSFKGSNRELRSKMLFHLVTHKHSNLEELVIALKDTKDRIIKNLQAFEKEGVLKKDSKEIWHIINTP